MAVTARRQRRIDSINWLPLNLNRTVRSVVVHLCSSPQNHGGSCRQTKRSSFKQQQVFASRQASDARRPPNRRTIARSTPKHPTLSGMSPHRPRARRLTESSPPPAILERIPGLRNGETRGQKSDDFLSLGRRHSSTSSELPSLNSAWERPHPKFTSTRGGSEFSKKSKEGEHATGTRNSEIDIMRSASPNSVYLPVEVIPAYCFIPIGHEKDYGEDNDFDDNYICKEEGVGQSTAAATIIVKKPLASPAPSGKSFAQKGGSAFKDVDQAGEVIRRSKAIALALALSKMLWRRALAAAVPMVLMNPSASGPALAAVRWLLSQSVGAAERVVASLPREGTFYSVLAVVILARSVGARVRRWFFFKLDG